MYYEFSRMARELGHRGWRLEEDEDCFYLSKFDERYNEDEFRFYIKNINQKLHIIRKVKIKPSNTPVPIRENSPYYKTAKVLCNAFEAQYPSLLLGIS